MMMEGQPVMMEAQHVGIVKSFNPSKGWGFIECEQTKLMYGSDVFLLKGELQGFGVSKGDHISFSVKQGQKGIQATGIKVIGNPNSNGEQGPTFFGEIKTFNAQKGFGFISCPASEQIFGKDIFVMKSELPGGMVGQGTQVQFKAKLDERGPVATDVSVIGMGASAQWNAGWPQWGAGTPQGVWGSWGPPWGGYGAAAGAGMVKVPSET